MICANCRTALTDEAEFCMKCGNRLKKSIESTEVNNNYTEENKSTHSKLEYMYVCPQCGKIVNGYDSNPFIPCYYCKSPYIKTKILCKDFSKSSNIHQSSNDLLNEYVFNQQKFNKHLYNKRLEEERVSREKFVDNCMNILLFKHIMDILAIILIIVIGCIGGGPLLLIGIIIFTIFKAICGLIDKFK